MRIFLIGFNLKKVELNSTFPDYITQIKKNFQNGLSDFGAPDEVEPITSGAEIRRSIS